MAGCFRASTKDWGTASLTWKAEDRDAKILKRKVAIAARRVRLQDTPVRKLFALSFVVLAASMVMSCDRAAETYASSCSTPPADWGGEREGIAHLRSIQFVHIRQDGSTLWNNVAISDEKLRRYMALSTNFNPEPQVILEVSPEAPCARVDAVRAIMDATSLCKGPHSLCSEGSNWRRWPEPAQ